MTNDNTVHTVCDFVAGVTWNSRRSRGTGETAKREEGGIGVSKLGTLIVVLEEIELYACSEYGGYVDSPIKESLGIEALQDAQARWENSIYRTTSIREEFYDRDSWFGEPWKIEYSFRYSAR